MLHSSNDEHFAVSHLQSGSLVAKVPPPQQAAPISLPDEHHSTHGVAGLDCRAHGGPESSEITQELVYWKDLPLDNDYVSPLKSVSERQYLTFEPDGGK